MIEVWVGSEYASIGSMPDSFCFFLVTPCLVVAVQPCMEWIPIEKITQGFKHAWLWLNNALCQGSEYASSMFHRVLNNHPVLNMLGLRIWEGCEYVVTQDAEYAWTGMSMS